MLIFGASEPFLNGFKIHRLMNHLQIVGHPLSNRVYRNTKRPRTFVCFEFGNQIQKVLFLLTCKTSLRVNLIIHSRIILLFLDPRKLDSLISFRLFPVSPCFHLLLIIFIKTILLLSVLLFSQIYLGLSDRNFDSGNILSQVRLTNDLPL